MEDALGRQGLPLCGDAPTSMNIPSGDGGRNAAGPSGSACTDRGCGTAVQSSAGSSGRKSTLPVQALVHAFHCTDAQCR
eukprot:scaffold15874_cov150-Isochrysis_galbana.AAC.3